MTPPPHPLLLLPRSPPYGSARPQPVFSSCASPLPPSDSLALSLAMRAGVTRSQGAGLFMLPRALTEEPELCWDAFWARKEPPGPPPCPCPLLSDFLYDYEPEFRLFWAVVWWSRRLWEPRSRLKKADVRGEAQKAPFFPEQKSAQAQSVPWGSCSSPTPT